MEPRTLISRTHASRRSMLLSQGRCQTSGYASDAVFWPNNFHLLWSHYLKALARDRLEDTRPTVEPGGYCIISCSAARHCCCDLCTCTTYVNGERTLFSTADIRGKTVRRLPFMISSPISFATEASSGKSNRLHSSSPHWRGSKWGSNFRLAR